MKYKLLTLTGRGEVAQSVKRTALGAQRFDHRSGRPFPTGWVGVSIM